MNSRVAQTRLGFGLPAIPAAPSIVSVVDNGDQASITVTVSGNGTIQLYYRRRNTTAWTAGQSRSGAGQIVQGGLIAGAWYDLYITDTVDGIESPPSAISIIRVIDSSDTSIESAIKAILTGDVTVAAIVDDRVYPNIIPQNEISPSLTYQQISGPRDHTMDGPSGLVDARYQINCFTPVYSETDTLAESVRLAMDGFSATVNTVQIDSIELLNENDLPEVDEESDAITMFGKRMDFMIRFVEVTG